MKDIFAYALFLLSLSLFLASDTELPPASYEQTDERVGSTPKVSTDISPNHGQNPAFKTVSYNATNFEPTDFTTCFTDQSTTSWAPSDKYTFSAEYGVPHVSKLTGKLSRKKFDDIADGLRKTYKAGKGEASYIPIFAFLVQ